MIVLTRLDGFPVAVNEDLMVFAEKTPDTVITMSSGQRLMVRESIEQLIDRIAEFRRRTLPVIGPEGVTHG